MSTITLLTNLETDALDNFRKNVLHCEYIIGRKGHEHHVYYEDR
jgi:hypothetical protein